MKSQFSFKKSNRLLHSRQFQEMAQGEQRVGKHLVIQLIKEKNCLSPKLGLTVSRHFGKAHDRNRFKRLVREAFRTSFTQLGQGLHLNVKPRKYALKATLEEIQKEIITLTQS